MLYCMKAALVQVSYLLKFAGVVGASAQRCQLLVQLEPLRDWRLDWLGSLTFAKTAQG